MDREPASRSSADCSWDFEGLTRRPSVSLVATHVLGVASFEEIEHLSGLGVTTQVVFGEERLSVDGHVEDTFGPHREAQRVDDVLEVVDQVIGRAHGAG